MAIKDKDLAGTSLRPMVVDALGLFQAAGAAAYTPSTDFASFISGLGTSNPYIVYVDRAITLQSSVAIPTNIGIMWAGGYFTASSAYTLTLNGTFTAPLTHVFRGSMLARFGQGSAPEAYIQWWGAKGDDSTDCAAAWNAATAAANLVQSMRVRVVAGKYRVSSALRIRPNVDIIGDAKSYVIPTTAGMNVFDCSGSLTADFNMHSISVVNSLGLSGIIGMDIVQCRHNVLFSKMYFESCKKAVYAHNLNWQTTFRDCYALLCNTGFEVTNSSHQIMFDRCTALSSQAVRGVVSEGGGVSTSGSPTLTGLVDTADFQVGDHCALSAGWASTTVLYCIVSKTATSLTFEYNATSNQTGITAANALLEDGAGFYLHGEVNDIEPFLSKSMLMQCLSQAHQGYGIITHHTDGTQIIGGYVEANTKGDIYFDESFYSITDHVWGGGNGGAFHIKGKNCQAMDLRGVLCPGSRTIGTFDVDTTNIYSKASLQRASSNNLLSGVYTGLNMQETKNGTLRLGNIGHGTTGTEAYKMYGVADTVLSSARHWHPITNNQNDKIDVSTNNTISCVSQYDVWRKGVKGGEYFTFTNPMDGQHVFLILRGSSDMGNRPTAINVAGYNINMSGAAANQNTCIAMAYDGDYGWIILADTGWDQANTRTLYTEGLRYRALSAVPTTGTYKKGDVVDNNNITSTNGIHGWKCLTSGTFSAFSQTCGSINGSSLLIGLTTTGLQVGDFLSMTPDATSFAGGTIAQVLAFRTNGSAVEGAGVSTNGSPSVAWTGTYDISDFNVGDFVTVSAGWPSTTIPYKILAKTTTALTLSVNATSSQTGITVQAVAGTELDTTAIATVASPGITVSTPDPTFERFGRALDKDFSVSYSNAGATNYVLSENSYSSVATEGNGISANGSPILTFSGTPDLTDFFAGDYVSVSAGWATTGPYKISSKTTTTLTLDTNANATTSPITVAVLTSASSSAKFHAKTAGAQGGNPYFQWEIPGIQGFSAGINNALSGDPFQLCNASSLGTNIVFEVDGSQNIGIFGSSSVGGGNKVIFIKNATTAPTSNPAGGGILYVTGGALTYRGSGGTTTTIGPA